MARLSIPCMKQTTAPGRLTGGSSFTNSILPRLAGQDDLLSAREILPKLALRQDDFAAFAAKSLQQNHLARSSEFRSVKAGEIQAGRQRSGGIRDHVMSGVHVAVHQPRNFLTCDVIQNE